MDPARLSRSADRLYEDLAGLGLAGVTFTRDTIVDVPGIGPVECADPRRRAAASSGSSASTGPLTRDVAPDAKLQEAKEFSTSVPVLLIDDTEITHNLPSASRRVIRALA